MAYHKPSNIEMPRRLLRCLNGLDWLNDEVINIYMGLLQVHVLLSHHILPDKSLQLGCLQVRQRCPQAQQYRDAAAPAALPERPCSGSNKPPFPLYTLYGSTVFLHPDLTCNQCGSTMRSSTSTRANCRSGCFGMSYAPGRWCSRQPL